MEQKIQKKFFVSYINAFEFGVEILAIMNRLLAIGSQCVNKHHLDFT